MFYVQKLQYAVLLKQLTVIKKCQNINWQKITDRPNKAVSQLHKGI